MTKIIYFDTNIYDHISKKIGFNDNDLILLKSKIAEKKISILYSLLNVTEISLLWNQDKKMTQEQLNLLLELVDNNNLLKPNDLLIKHEVNRFLNNSVSYDPYYHDNDLVLKINTLLKNLSLNEKIINDSNIEEKNLKQNMHVGMINAKLEVAKEVKKLNKKNIKHPNFNQYRNSLKIGLLKPILANIRKLNKCRERGLHNLLKHKSIRIYIDTSISLVYSQTFNKKAPDDGDGIDLKHVLLATAADIFVTDDKKLINLFKNFEHKDFKVIDLKAFMEEIKNPSF